MSVFLIAEVLDEQLQDNGRRNAGRVDGLVLETRDGRPPRVAYIEVGPVTLLARFSTRLARWYARLDARLPDRAAPFRIPWTRVRRDGPTLLLDFDATATPIYALENWLRTSVLSHIPGH